MMNQILHSLRSHSLCGDQCTGRSWEKRGLGDRPQCSALTAAIGCLFTLGYCIRLHRLKFLPLEMTLWDSGVVRETAPPLPIAGKVLSSNGFLWNLSLEKVYTWSWEPFRFTFPQFLVWFPSFPSSWGKKPKIFDLLELEDLLQAPGGFLGFLIISQLWLLILS